MTRRKRFDFPSGVHHCETHREYTVGCAGCREKRRLIYWVSRDGRNAARRADYRQKRDLFAARTKAYREGPKGAKWREKRRDYQRWYALKRNYGLSREDYLRLWSEQHGACAICEKRFSRDPSKAAQSVHVDHDHETGEVRALLCPQCNTVVGLTENHPELLEKAIRYLRHPRPDVKPNEPANGPYAEK